MKILHVFILFIALCKLPVSNSLGGAVLGIDFGAQFYKISLISNGQSFTIIENTNSKRKTSTAISFTEGQRQYESEAMNKKTRYPENTFIFIKKFLGALKTNEKVLEISKKNFEQFLCFYDDLDDDSDDVVEEIVYLHVEEIVAMILRHGKKMAEKFAKLDQITDCVITIPSNWNLDQRKMMIEAAKLAGLIPIGLIKENTAAALQYAIDKKDEKKQEIILFYNLGASQLQLSIAEFNYVEIQDKTTIKKKQIMVKAVNILADTINLDISSKAFDLVLANYFAGLFDQTKNRVGKTSIKQNYQSMLKLLKQSETIKEKLSANKETHLYQESLIDGEDFTTVILRSTFEQECEGLVQELIRPINDLLKSTNILASDIDQVEMIGGGVRIPFVQKTINEYFGQNKMGFHLNGDESMALGAAFMAANLSSDIRVKPLWLSDGYEYSFKLCIESTGNDETTAINKTIAPIGSKKAITFESSDNIKLSVYLVNEEEENSEKLIIQYQFNEINNILKDKKYSKCSTPKLHFKFKLTSIDPITLDKAEVTLKKGVETETEKENQESEDEEENEENEEENQEKDQEKDETEKTQETKSKQKDIKQYKLSLKTITSQFGLKSLTNDQIKASKALLRKFDSHELFIQKNSQSKNTLESLIYKSQELLTDQKFKKYSTTEEIEQLKKLAEENEDWLYCEEAKNANYMLVTKKVDALNFLINRIEQRKEEGKTRPNEIKSALKKLDEKEKKLTNLFNKTMPWVSHGEKKPVIEIIQLTRTWILEKKGEQDKKKINEDPAFLVVELQKKMNKAIGEYDKIRNIPNPNIGKKEEPSKKEDNKKEEKKKKDGKKTQKEEIKTEEKEKQNKEEKEKTFDKDEL